MSTFYETQVNMYGILAFRLFSKISVLKLNVYLFFMFVISLHTWNWYFTPNSSVETLQIQGTAPNHVQGMKCRMQI